MTTLDDLYRAALERLRHGVATPALDARWLVADAAGVPAEAVVLRGGQAIALDVVDAAMAAVDRRLAGVPVDRILGVREFWGLPFRLSPATLSPRPDTETVVSAALEAIGDRQRPVRLLDLGTGSGALLVALLHELPHAWGLGIDRSPEAAHTARSNAAANGVSSRAALLVGNWAAALAGHFDLVVSNPPYIKAATLGGLEREVREHDPVLALDGGPDGLDAYRAILAEAPRLLTPGGVLVLELGAGQEAGVAALARAQGLAMDGPARPDLGGIPRALVVRQAPIRQA